MTWNEPEFLSLRDEADSRGGSKAAHYNSGLLKVCAVMERMWQHSHGTVLPAIHVVLCLEHLEVGRRPFWLWQNLRPSARVMKRSAEVEARLHIATQGCQRFIRVWIGCGSTPMAPCCLPSMWLFAWSAREWVAILAQIKSDDLSQSDETVS